MKEPKPLTVIDPGLMDASGHHAGFASMLAQNLDVSRSVTIYSHRRLDASLKIKLTEAGQHLRPGWWVN